MIIELFSRPGCHLCEEAKKVILDARGRHPFDFLEHNVEERNEWESQYGQEIPVVLINGKKAFKFHVPPQKLERYFAKKR